MKYKGLKRRKIRSKPGGKRPEHIIPHKKIDGQPYSQTSEYKYFEGHVVPEIAKQLSVKSVVCWYNDQMLSVPMCAINKFRQQRTHCKRCSLFQKDEHSQELRSLVEDWEMDDLEEE